MHAGMPGLVWRLPLWICLAGLVAALNAGAFVVCGACGHENALSANACSHCGAGLPSVEAAPRADAADGQQPSDSGARWVDVSVVEQDVAMGDERAAEGDVWLAYFLYRNAAALELLTDPQSGGERGAAISEKIDGQRHGTRLVRGACAQCRGTGRRRLKVTRLGGEVTYQEVPGRFCPACRGERTVLRYGDARERQVLRGRAWQRYVQLRRAMRYVPVGNAWIPAELEGALAHRQVAALKRAAADPCRECLGSGRLDCRPCGGSGHLERGDRMEPCAACSGGAWVICGVCRGTGDRPVCGRCDGEGIQDCPRCRGSGRYRGGECERCRGEGAGLCPSCRGDGRR